MKKMGHGIWRIVQHCISRRHIRSVRLMLLTVAVPIMAALLAGFAVPQYFTGTASAVSAAGTGSITVTFWREERAVPDAEFRIYRVAAWDGNGYTLLTPFSGYPVKGFDDADSGEWRALAGTLLGIAERDNLPAYAAGRTDGTGRLTFGNLEDGMYLLAGSMKEFADERLFPQAMLVTVPCAREDGTKEYDVVTEPKYEARKVTDETVRLRAIKIWKDEGNRTKRPESVTVQLLCDGRIYAEQVLSPQNNWSCTWENLNAAHDWKLLEKEVPEGYTLQVTREDMTFTLTNTNDNPPPPTPGEPGLPQTGLLWWPVPVLAGAGIAVLFSGIFLLLRKSFCGVFFTGFQKF